MRPYRVSLLVISPGRLVNLVNRFAFPNLGMRAMIAQAPRCRYLMIRMVRSVRAGKRGDFSMAKRCNNRAAVDGDMLHTPFRASRLFRELRGRAPVGFSVVRRPMLR